MLSSSAASGFIIANPECVMNRNAWSSIDETSVNTRMTRLRMTAPFGHWATQTFIAGLRCDGLTAPWVIPGAMDRDAFDVYISSQLAPTLAKGDVVILDNLVVHKSPKAAEALRDIVGPEQTISLPPY